LTANRKAKHDFHFPLLDDRDFPGIPGEKECNPGWLKSQSIISSLPYPADLYTIQPETTQKMIRAQGDIATRMAT
jgi:hypothetical protein